jgi:hypothetical protein
MVSIVASFLGVPMLVSSVFVDVVACVTRLPVVNDALQDRCHLLDSRRRFLVDKNLPLMLCWLGVLFRGRSSMSRG